MKKSFLFLLVFGVVFNALYAKTEVNQKPFEELVIRYHHGFNLSMRKAQFEHLKEILTQEVYNKTFTWIDAWQANNIFIDSRLLGLNFGEVKMKRYSAELTTTEMWKYRYIQIVDKEVVMGPTKVFYKIKYHFVELEDGTWKINQIQTIDEKSEDTKW